MANIIDSTKNMLSNLGAIQTLVENFPMHFISLDDLKFSTSFDVLSILFKMFGVQREELIEVLTNALCGGMKETSDGSGFISQAEEIVKMALEANIINILNCTTNPIISDNLLDKHKNKFGVDESGDGITLKVSEIDFTGVLNRNPFTEDGSKFYFDVEGRTPNTLCDSKDFNAFLWYIINRSDPSQEEKNVWDDRYRSAIYGSKKKDNAKQIIRCTYIDEDYPYTDSIKIQLASENYYRTRKIGDLGVNKTIFEFNHEFLSSIKLYEPKVVIAEIVEYLLGEGNVSINIGFGANEKIIEGKIQQIIKDIEKLPNTEINDCYYNFSNDEYNEMLEKAERNRFNMVNYDGKNYKVNPSDVLNDLSGITTTSTLVEDKTIIENTFTKLLVSPAQDMSAEVRYGLEYDWSFELMRMLVYPFVRPLFTPKVLFLLMVNKKIMGSLKDSRITNPDELLESLMGGLFNIIRDIILRLKDLIVQLLINFLMEKIRPLLELFAAKLLMETMKIYKDLLMQLMENCLIGWKRNPLTSTIDDVNYADIIPTQIQPNQQNC